jgi:uncharacterized protein GlcG (DUF336 family)
MSMITLEQANRIIEAIFGRGRELACRPMSVIIVEPGAKVKAFQKEDDSAMMRFEMAYGKAYAALALGAVPHPWCACARKNGRCSCST